MLVYWSIAMFTVLIHLLPVKKDNQYSVRLFVSLIPLFFYGAFRVDFGLDYVGYEDFFDGVKSIGYASNERMEIGYFYLNKILPTFRSLLILQSILLCAAYYYLFKWYIPAKYSWLGFLLLFLSGPLTVFFMLSGIRNGIAISILILSTNFTHKRKIILFVIFVFIASLFHKSVLLMAPIIYFIANGTIIKRKNIIIWLSIMVFFLLSSQTFILDYIDMFITFYFDRYAVYVSFAKEHGTGAGILISVFSLGVSTIILFLVKDKHFTAKENMILKLTLLFFLSYLLGPLNMRMSQYFASFFIAGSIIIMNVGSKKLLKKVYFFAVFAYLIYALMLWFDNPYYSYDTYQSVLFN
jgi:EpsG family